MFGGVVPPIPTNEFPGGHLLMSETNADQNIIREKKEEEEEEEYEVIYHIIAGFVVWQE